MRSAKQAYTEAAVLTATPERLVVMLFDGANRFLARAAASLARRRAVAAIATSSAPTRSSTS